VDGDIVAVEEDLVDLHEVVLHLQEDEDDQNKFLMHFFLFLVDVMLSGLFFVLFLLIFSFKIVIFYMMMHIL
jgi:hypothetical protein